MVGDQNEKLGLTVAVDPVVAIPAAMVKVSGKTVALGDSPTVKITRHGRGGRHQTQEAQLRESIRVDERVTRGREAAPLLTLTRCVTT